MEKVEKIAVVGLGYVGLPLAVELSLHYPVIGYDVNFGRIEACLNLNDVTGEVNPKSLKQAIIENGLKLVWDITGLSSCTLFIICVPTPVDKNGAPDLSHVHDACALIASIVTPGTIIVIESTVAPGTTEGCAVGIARISGLVHKKDFWVGFSPERVSPGDSLRSLKKVKKLVAADCSDSLSRIKKVYESIIEAGVYEAPSIKVAEASKLLENAQREVNIALMNEASQIFHKLGIKTADVIECARTKFNFGDYTPGLVGGHCIGVDTYYLADAGLKHGAKPNFLLSAVKTNENMVYYIGAEILSFLSKSRIHNPRIAIFGLTYKENVPDLRNSGSAELALFLGSVFKENGSVFVHDPCCDAADALARHGIMLSEFQEIYDIDVLVLAVPHKFYFRHGLLAIDRFLNQGGAVFDLKSVLAPECVPSWASYWSL